MNKDGIYYKAGEQAFMEGKALADKPHQYLTSEWDTGFLDAMAKAVRELIKK